MRGTVTTQCLTDNEVETAVTVIYSMLQMYKAPARRFVSLDIEWASERGARKDRRVDLIQLAIQHRVFLIRTHNWNELHPSLARLLGDVTVIKVSAGIIGMNS